MDETPILREREVGYCLVTNKQGGCWHLRRNEFPRVRAAWIKGAKKVDTIEFHGSTGTIDLTDVDSVLEVPPEAVVNAIAEHRADDADDSLTTR